MITITCSAGSRSELSSSRVRHGGGGDTHGGDEMDDQPGKGRLARRPVRRPETATEGERDTFLGELLVHS